MRFKKSIITILFIIFIILFLNTSSYAGYQEWNFLDYNVTLKEDGSMDVIETWDVYVSETNTLFKKFDLENGNYKINNVSIVEINDDETKKLNQIYEEQYHVDSGCFYGLMTNSDTFEIAWNVGLDDSSGNRIYKIYYTVENAVKIYEDCTELYWQFLSNENTMIGENVSGSIKLPNPVSDMEKLRIWGHGDLTAEITKKSKDEIVFTLNKLKSRKMLEIRVITEENIYPQSTNKFYKEHLNKVLKEEQEWANKANEEREKVRDEMKLIGFVLIIAVIVNIFVLIIFLLKNKKYRAIRKELKEKYSSFKNELEYFREIPNEKNATPARAVYMYNFNKNTSNIQNKISKIFSSTLLNLALKGFISFEVISEKDVRIYRTEKEENLFDLSEDETIIYDILKAAMLRRDSITSKEFSKIISKDYDLFYPKLNKIEDIVKDFEIRAGKISEEKMKISQAWTKKGTLFCLYAFFAFFIVQVLPAILIGFIILAVSCFKNAASFSILTENGLREVEEWKGLKKYMEDYSLLREKLVPDIVLWEKYLVYATAFGISKKVIEQLKIVHPEMFVNNNDNVIRNYAYWHIISDSNFDNSFENLNKSLEKVYNDVKSAYDVAHSSDSSGSGGGGGFSGGGGGRRWRRKLRRTLENYNYKNEKIFNLLLIFYNIYNRILTI